MNKRKIKADIDKPYTSITAVLIVSEDGFDLPLNVESAWQTGKPLLVKYSNGDIAMFRQGYRQERLSNSSTESYREVFDGKPETK